MDTIYNLQKRADELRKKTETDSITPEDVGGLHADTLAYMAGMEQNAEGLGIRRVYASYAAMTAEGESPTGTDGRPLKFGQLAAIYDAENTTQAETGNIYAWQKGTGAAAWLQVGNLSNVYELRDAIDKATEKAEATAAALEEVKTEVSGVQGDLDDFKATKGAAGGIAPLDGWGRIAEGLLPDSATDVVEFGGFVDGVEILPMSVTDAGTVVYDRTAKQFALRVGVLFLSKYYNNWTTRGLYEDGYLVPLPGKLYVNTQDKKIYRWTGEDLEEVSGQLAIGVTADTAFAGNRGLALETDMKGVKYGMETKVEKSDVEIIEASINKSITTETSERKAADTAEATERKAADTKLQGQIDALDKFAVMTEDEYDALETKDENTYYMLTED